MESLKHLIREIHRRSIWQVLAIYIGASWIVFEVVQTLTEGLGLPEWFPAFALVLLLVGLPIVLGTAFVQQGGPVIRGQDSSPIPADTGRGEPGSGDRAEGRDPSGRPTGLRRLFSWRNAITGGVLAFALWGVIAAGWLLFARGHETPHDAVPALDAAVVAVFPFRISGADPSLEYLREGMVDLLAAKLTGQGGPRAVDPRVAISAWQRVAASDTGEFTEQSALEAARALGAGRVVLGGVVGTPNRIVLNATLLTVAGNDRRMQASVEGSLDSLTALVDRLTAELLALGAGEAQQRLAALTSTSLPALRAHLDGQRAYRRGNYVEAVDLFNRAIARDSGFALAAVGRMLGKIWTDNAFDPVGLHIAWTHRDRLSERDRALLLAYWGPRYPEASSFAERIAAAERAVEIAPDRPEVWYQLGEWYFHQGPAVGLTNTRQLARDAFSRAVALDSTFTAPLSHLLDLAVLAGDREYYDRLYPIYAEVDTSGDFVGYVHWQGAHAFEGPAALDSVRARFKEMPTLSLRAIARQAQLRGTAPEDVARAIDELRGRAGTRGERWGTLTLIHDVELNRGRPQAALAATRRMPQLQPWPRFHLWIRLLDALYGDGDPDAAAEAARELAGHAEAALSDQIDERAQQYADICALEQWRLWNGDVNTVARSIEKLQTAEFPRDSSSTAAFAATCRSILEAIWASTASRPEADAKASLERLDQRMNTLPPGSLEFFNLQAFGNLIVARLHSNRGDTAKALEAVRRRVYFWTRYLASHLREEGRLAALTGDRDGAVRAYRHYLALRTDPEPTLTEDVESVRAALAALLDEAGS